MRIRFLGVLFIVFGVLQAALAVHVATAFPLHKHPTQFAVETVRTQLAENSRLSAAETVELNRQLGIVLSNERAFQSAWSKLWPLSPIAFGGSALLSLLAAAWILVASRPKIRLPSNV